jgi:hypothetical protein
MAMQSFAFFLLLFGKTLKGWCEYILLLLFYYDANKKGEPS